MPSSLMAPVATRREAALLLRFLDRRHDPGVLLLVEIEALPGRLPRRACDMTPAICLGPITAIFAVGHRNVNRLPNARPDIP